MTSGPNAFACDSIHAATPFVGHMNVEVWRLIRSSESADGSAGAMT